jgi:hypothetical protein
LGPQDALSHLATSTWPLGFETSPGYTTPRPPRQLQPSARRPGVCRLAADLARRTGASSHPAGLPRLGSGARDCSIRARTRRTRPRARALSSPQPASSRQALETVGVSVVDWKSAIRLLEPARSVQRALPSGGAAAVSRRRRRPANGRHPPSARLRSNATPACGQTHVLLPLASVQACFAPHGPNQLGRGAALDLLRQRLTGRRVSRQPVLGRLGLVRASRPGWPNSARHVSGIGFPMPRYRGRPALATADSASGHSSGSMAALDSRGLGLRISLVFRVSWFGFGGYLMGWPGQAGHGLNQSQSRQERKAWPLHRSGMKAAQGGRGAALDGHAAALGTLRDGRGRIGRGCPVAGQSFEWSASLAFPPLHAVFACLVSFCECDRVERLGIAWRQPRRWELDRVACGPAGGMVGVPDGPMRCACVLQPDSALLVALGRSQNGAVFSANRWRPGWRGQRSGWPVVCRWLVIVAHGDS